VNLGQLNISEVVKQSQSGNGLKRGDYDRYRKYCVNRVKRIRKGLKFSYGKRYVSKDIM
jgi:signal recognition particle subunit SRP68